MSSSFQDKINQIVSDRTHGSSSLLKKIISVFLSTKLSPDELYWSYNQLNNIDSSMVVIHHFLKELKPAMGHDFREQVRQYQGKWENVNIDIARNLQDHLADKKLTVLTHSHSGVIIDVLMNLVSNGYLIDVIQTASEPGSEGHVQAKAIKQLGIDVRIIKDESLSSSVEQVNCCFLGVDHYDHKSFVNKIGSKVIVDTAAQFNKPVFVLGDSRKLVDSTNTGTTRLFEIVPLKSHVRLINEKTI